MDTQYFEIDILKKAKQITDTGKYTGYLDFKEKPFDELVI